MTHEACLVSGDGEAVQDAAGPEGPRGSRASVPSVLMLLRQLNVAQLVNNPGGPKLRG